MGPALPHRHPVGARPGRTGPTRLDTTRREHLDPRLDGDRTLGARGPAQADRAARRDTGRARRPADRPSAYEVARERKSSSGPAPASPRSSPPATTNRRAREAGRAALSGPGRGRREKRCVTSQNEPGGAATTAPTRTVRDERLPSPTAAVRRRWPASATRALVRPRHRRDALAQCLVCPARPWCAREALNCRASWGMWAGVWIDGRHNDALPYLTPSPKTMRRPARIGGHQVGASHEPPGVLAPLRRPPARTPSRSVTAAVLARSSGHCEVFAEGCRYTLDRLVSRCRMEPPVESGSPAKLFAACMACAEIVIRLEPQLATRAGYVVDTGRDPASVAVSLARISVGPARPRRVAHRDPRGRADRLAT